MTRIVVTGGAGFVGRAVVRRLLDRGDTAVAVVRDPHKAGDLAALGAELAQDDLADIERLTRLLDGADGAIHAAGSYRVGIPKADRPAMWDANVGTTTRFLDAAHAAAVPRLVYLSTGNVYGNTRGLHVDESYRRDLTGGFLSWYDETKFRAHEAADRAIRGGAPLVLAMLSQVYGPGDHSGCGEQLTLANQGRLPYRTLDDLGVNLVHVDDVAAGIVAALDGGRPGEAYNLAGPPIRLKEAIEAAARIGGHRPPRLSVPTALLRVMAPFGGLIGQPNLREVISAAAGVTYWLSADKAKAELGFTTREIEQGFRDTFANA